MSDATKPSIATRLAHAGFDEHRLRGRLLFGELLNGNASFWSMVSLAAGGPELDACCSAVWNDLAVAATIADPRIWPLKIARLGAAYGTRLSGLAAAELFTAGARVGAGATGQCADQLVALRNELGASLEDPAAIEAALESRARRRERFLGFGVPQREYDERVVAILPRLEAFGRLELPYWRLLESIGARMERRRAPLNIAGVMAAVGLDMGAPPPVVEALAVAASLAPLIGNAWESAEQRADALRRIPDEWIEDRSAPPRESPRALAARESPRASATRGR
jgi:hypothetical protein